MRETKRIIKEFTFEWKEIKDKLGLGKGELQYWHVENRSVELGTQGDLVIVMEVNE